MHEGLQLSGWYLLYALYVLLLVVCRYLYRPYGRVDRTRLKSKLLNRCVEHGMLCSFHQWHCRGHVDRACFGNMHIRFQRYNVYCARPGFLTWLCCFAGVTFYETKADSVEHADGTSTLTCSDGKQLTAGFVLDCTGHARRLVEFDQKFDPGYQAAYGMMIEVESHPFELDTMLFMDWRDDHTKVNS